MQKNTVNSINIHKWNVVKARHKIVQKNNTHTSVALATKKKFPDLSSMRNGMKKKRTLRYVSHAY